MTIQIKLFSNSNDYWKKPQQKRFSQNSPIPSLKSEIFFPPLSGLKICFVEMRERTILSRFIRLHPSAQNAGYACAELFRQRPHLGVAREAPFVKTEDSRKTLWPRGEMRKPLPPEFAGRECFSFEEDPEAKCRGAGQKKRSHMSGLKLKKEMTKYKL